MFQIWFLVPTVFTSFCAVINQAGALPAPSSEPSTPSALNESSEVCLLLKTLFLLLVARINSVSFNDNFFNDFSYVITYPDSRSKNNLMNPSYKF